MILDASTKQAWNLFVSQHAQEMEEFIQTWDHKGCAQFKLEKIRCDWTPSRRASRGGLYTSKGIKTPGISIAMARYIPRYGDPVRHYEYKSFDADKFIGGFYTNNMEHPLLAVIAHEVAHAIQFWLWWYNSTAYGKPHGKEFKKHYAKLRAVFVNPLLPEQDAMGEAYRKHKNIVVHEAFFDALGATH